MQSTGSTGTDPRACPDEQPTRGTIARVPDTSTSGMIALIPRDDDAQSLAVPNGDPADDLHLTLAYLGDDVDNTIDDDQLDALHDLLEASARTQPPLEGRVMAHAAFNPDGGPDGDRDPCAVHLIGDSDSLTPLREWLIRTMQRGDEYPTPPQQHDPFIPHVTGGYGIDPGDLRHTGPVMFDRMRLAVGPNSWDFPLGGQPDPRMEGKSLERKAAKSDTHKPPQSVVNNAKRALEKISDGKAGANFTDTGRARAKQLASGDAVSLDVVKRMHNYFSRHGGSDQGHQSNENSPAGVAWLAWGGDAGRAWARSIVGESKVAPWALPMAAYGDPRVLEVKNKVATDAGAQRYGVPVGTELGQARDQREQDAQNDPRARELYSEGLNSPTPDKLALKVEALDDADLERLTRVAYSFRSKDPRVVALRIACANALAAKGKNVTDYGARGGGKGGGKGGAGRPRLKGDDNGDGTIMEDESGWDAHTMGNRRGTNPGERGSGKRPKTNAEQGITNTAIPEGYDPNAIVGPRAKVPKAEKTESSKDTGKGGKGTGKGKKKKNDAASSPEAERGRQAGLAAYRAAGGKSGEPFDLEHKRYVSQNERNEQNDTHTFRGDGKYPVKTLADLDSAIKTFGQGKGVPKSELKRYLQSQASRLDAPQATRDRINALDTGEKSMGATETKVASPNPKAAKLRRWWAFNPKGRAKWKPGTPGDFNRLRRHLAKYVKAPHVLDGLTANIHKLATGSWPGKGRGHGGGEGKALFDYKALEYKAVPPERRDEVEDVPEGDDDAMQAILDSLPSAERDGDDPDQMPPDDDAPEDAPPADEGDEEPPDPDEGIETEELDDEAKALADDVPDDDEDALQADLSPDDFPDDDEIEEWMGGGETDGPGEGEQSGETEPNGGGTDDGAAPADEGEPDERRRPRPEGKALVAPPTPLDLRTGRNRAIGATLVTPDEINDSDAPEESWEDVVMRDVRWEPQADGSLAPGQAGALAGGGVSTASTAAPDPGAGDFGDLFADIASGGGEPADAGGSLWN